MPAALPGCMREVQGAGGCGRLLLLKEDRMLKKPLLHCMLLAVIALGGQASVYAQQSTSSKLQKGFSDLFSAPKEEDLLEPDKAFAIQTKFKGPTTLVAVLTPANGYYLYKNKIRFALKDAGGVVIKSVKLPTGELKNDPTFGKTETYQYPVQAEITLERAPKAKSFTLLAGYQGCHEKLGVCYAPIDKEIKLVLP